MNGDVDEKFHYDLFIIGGGINGAGIARDAAGRGFDVCLCEAGDFAGATSSSSSKLIHGGLRYLEYFEFRLVREALQEREILLKAMPHIAWPMRFVLPLHPDMRFEGGTPASRLISTFMPWLKGRRANWMIRLGLFVYDHLGGKSSLPKTGNLDLSHCVEGECLKEDIVDAYEYSDGWVDDARLVILNLMDAQKRGASVMPRTKVDRARFEKGKWRITLEDVATGQTSNVTASMIINAAGPWVDNVLANVFGANAPSNVRLVRGSHIVVPKKYDHDKCYFFQNEDSRIMFAIPWQEHYTLIGTTDADHESVDVKAEISDAEVDYLCSKASAWFKDPVCKQDIVWTYSGVRSLYNDGSSEARAATRDYVLRRDEQFGEGRLINIFGGKITTYRHLALSMMEKITATLGEKGQAWTHGAQLPGGDFDCGFDALLAQKSKAYPFLDEPVLKRMLRTHGTLIDEVLRGVTNQKDLGQMIVTGLYACELRYFVEHEWAACAEDVLFRRTKLGVGLSETQVADVEKAVRTILAE